MYLVFAYYRHYPNGGWEDFQKSFNNELDAKHFAYELVHGPVDDYKYAHVVFVEEKKIIYKVDHKGGMEFK